MNELTLFQKELLDAADEIGAAWVEATRQEEVSQKTLEACQKFRKLIERAVDVYDPDAIEEFYCKHKDLTND